MTIEDFNHLAAEEAEAQLTRCCGAHAWVTRMSSLRPFPSREALCDAAERLWWKLSPQDWLEAFSHHPRIGDRPVPASWSSEEQRGVAGAERATLEALAEGNRAYEERFGHVFLVCATGKSAGEMLTILNSRMGNDAATELRVAASEHAKITRIRIDKLFSRERARP